MDYKNKHLTPMELMVTFMSNVTNKGIVFIGGVNPFRLKVNDSMVTVYIKNLSPAQLSNNNPDIWRVQLPIKDEFESIKESNEMFILLGYDKERKVYTSWNPYWCKQRLNVGQSVSLYSRLSLQTRVHTIGLIERRTLNNDGDVICIPEQLIGEYILHIKEYYPEETTYVAKGSSLVKKKMENETKALDVFEKFKARINSNDFKNYMLANNITEASSNAYFRHVKTLIYDGYIDKYKDIFIQFDNFANYDEPVHTFLHTEEIHNMDKIHHRYYSTGLKHYLKFIQNQYCPPQQGIINFKSEVDENDNIPQKCVDGYNLDEYGKLTTLNDEIKVDLAKFIVGEDYPDYSEMYNLVCEYYPSSITDRMAFPDWIDLFNNEDWKKTKSNKSNSDNIKKAKETIKVTKKDGSIIKHDKVVDTYIEVIKENFPDLIMEIGIVHAGVNIVSTSYDEKYKDYQKDIGGGFLVFVNSSTKTKYEDLCKINEVLELELKIELIDKE